jgi:predicted NBD/HSP70 family sugar kinase
LTVEIQPILDPSFLPAARARRSWRTRVRETGHPVSVRVALERPDGGIVRHAFDAFPDGHPDAALNAHRLEREIKFLLWSRGGCRVHLDAPAALVSALRAHFAETVTGQFDRDIMGERIYEKPLELLHVAPGELPDACDDTRPLGRHLDGCRIGFDLGASDVKVAAVRDGAVLFSEEYRWDPVPQANPRYHHSFIQRVLHEAAAHLPRVDAIGGSSAGVYVDNRVKVASLFRSVPPDLFAREVKDLFLEIRRAWNNIPFEVVNDGEVTALAGSMSLNANAVLGIALGSSEAAGYVTESGTITRWLNELAFAPIDYQEDAPVDEWSRDRGCGVQYLSQQAVGRLLAPAGIHLPADMPLPEKLKVVQILLDGGDLRAASIFRTIGCYLGHAVAHYADFYAIRHVLILGRVTSGAGGTLILKTAKRTLEGEYPDVAHALQFHTPNERDKRHGQAIAAASLPAL